MAIEIRALTALSELKVAVELQTVYWGTSVESLVPAQMMFTIIQSGGHVLAAFDGERMVGVLIGLLAASDTPARDYLNVYSKRMVVLPEYRGQGIAQDLKFKQLDCAIAQGINCIIWTYDPLLAVNAHFNIRKLGTTAHEYVINYYGQDVDEYGLSILGASDRLIVQWNADSPEVMDRVRQQFVPKSLTEYIGEDTPILNLSTIADGIPHPADLNLSDNAQVMLEIPRDFRGLANAYPHLATKWRTQTRSLLTTYLCENGYAVVDFVNSEYKGLERAFYVLRKRDEHQLEG